MGLVTRTVLGVAVIGGIGVGALLLIAGADRVGALWRQATGSVNQAIDAQITDPVALRSQLASLAEQYPRRIAQVRSDLSEVRSHLTQLARERAIAARVAQLAEADLHALRNLLTRAEEARLVHASMTEARPIEIAFQDATLTIEQAYARASDASNTRTAYLQRIADIDRDTGHLQQQEQRLATMLARLETERADFQVQLWQLDRQVDSIARNDRMIAILNKTQASIHEQSRYRGVSLEQIASRVADIRARQEGELAALASLEQRSNYETRARATLNAEALQGAPAKGTPKAPPIRIQPRPGDELPASDRVAVPPAPDSSVPQGPDTRSNPGHAPNPSTASPTAVGTVTATRRSEARP
jgi:chromosome segregation ATPase